MDDNLAQDKKDLTCSSDQKWRKEDAKYGVNIIRNSNLKDGLDGWYPMGDCCLTVGTGNPLDLPSDASAHGSLLVGSGFSPCENFLHVSNRTELYHGPAQDITDQIQLFSSYQVTAWVCLGSSTDSDSDDATIPLQKVNVAIDVDGQWNSGGEVLASAIYWTEVSGSFRLETEAKQIIVYVQGPGAGVDVKVAGLQICEVNRLARVPLLQEQTDKVRKRNVVVRLRDPDGEFLPPGTPVSIRQTTNDFPIGTCINHFNLEGDDSQVYRDFFLDHFNWAVFENELKWEQTEPTRGVLRYEDADAMVEFCKNNRISMRGHCIIWEANVPGWVQELDGEDLEEAVHNRFTELLTKYNGTFQHYDVNNEMLHGSFYRDRLGPQFAPDVYKLAKQLDPQPALFVNDDHITDGFDCNSSPQKYVEQIRFLQENGAEIGGIGVQSHMSVPIGSIMSRALDELGVMGIPIWLTEVDVTFINEDVRADDLEVVLREAFAHPSVGGCLLWGFFQGAMSKENAHLVDSDWRINEAGRRLLALKKEWLTTFDGMVDDQGEVAFRGFRGDYTLRWGKEYFQGF